MVAKDANLKIKCKKILTFAFLQFIFNKWNTWHILCALIPLQKKTREKKPLYLSLFFSCNISYGPFATFLYNPGATKFWLILELALHPDPDLQPQAAFSVVEVESAWARIPWRTAGHPRPPLLTAPTVPERRRPQLLTVHRGHRAPPEATSKPPPEIGEQTDGKKHDCR